MIMRIDRNRADLWVCTLPKWLFIVTAIVITAGAAASVVWWMTGDLLWIRLFFSYPGALFFIVCNVLQAWLSLRCLARFSAGDLLRPAWLMITLASFSQVVGGVVGHVFALESYLNPFSALPPGPRLFLIQRAAALSEAFSPLYMVLLACGLAYVLKTCRHSGVLGRLKPVDWVLLAIVVVYTVSFFATTVCSPAHGGRELGLRAVISWSSDPLLCILLFQAILIRRSTANMGWGLISRCWISFTVAIFLTSVGDIGLWATSNGYLPWVLAAASWYVWFLPSAAFVLGPAYQLQAMALATCGQLTTRPAAVSPND